MKINVLCALGRAEIPGSNSDGEYSFNTLRGGQGGRSSNASLHPPPHLCVSTPCSPGSSEVFMLSFLDGNQGTSFQGEMARSPKQNLPSLHLQKLPTQLAWARRGGDLVSLKPKVPRSPSCTAALGEGARAEEILFPGACRFEQRKRRQLPFHSVSIDPGACGIWRRKMGLCPVSRVHSADGSVPRLHAKENSGCRCCLCLGLAAWPSWEDRSLGMKMAGQSRCLGLRAGRARETAVSPAWRS